jgi:hypothetical protein
MAASAAAMKMTPPLRRLAGPAPRLCRAAIPGPGTCAGKGLGVGVGGSDEAGATSIVVSFFQIDRSFIDC